MRVKNWLSSRITGSVPSSQLNGQQPWFSNMRRGLLNFKNRGSETDSALERRTLHLLLVNLGWFLRFPLGNTDIFRPIALLTWTITADKGVTEVPSVATNTVILHVKSYNRGCSTTYWLDALHFTFPIKLLHNHLCQHRCTPCWVIRKGKPTLCPSTCG